ncbi:hypothetical protein [Candidatus Accumulibacter contiguus]|jgi:hypothetical protein|uniref:hypothetical protein n=1 Tax=Candidatus Accumulibacter contiguus TaxID=2954381 RepID=UPI002FC3D773
MVNGTTPSGHRFELVQLISGQILTIDWSLPADALPAKVTEAVEALEASLAETSRSPQELARLAHSIHLWYDDLRRVHLMSNDLAVNEFGYPLKPGQ